MTRLMRGSPIAREFSFELDGVRYPAIYRTKEAAERRMRGAIAHRRRG